MAIARESVSRICDGAARAIESMRSVACRSVACRNARGHAAARAKVTAKALLASGWTELITYGRNGGHSVGKASKLGTMKVQTADIRVGMMELSVEDSNSKL